MSIFEDRERSAERLFVQQRELPLKITARRNARLGLWAAGELGLTGEDATRYAASLIETEADGRDDALLVQKVFGDLKAHGRPATLADIEKRLKDLADEARRELGNNAAP